MLITVELAMKRFRFRLERVLQYRERLVEQQETEVRRKVMLLQEAEATLLEAARVHQEAVESLEKLLMAGSGAACQLLAPSWQALEASLERLRAAERRRDAAKEEVLEAQKELLRRKQDEQVLQKLKERQARRANLEMLREEAKELDDVATTRLVHQERARS